MDLHDVQALVKDYSAVLSTQFQRIPGSAIIVRYIKNSYQNDPIRSAIELILFLFALKYLLSPSYSMQRGGQVELTDEVCDNTLGRVCGQVLERSEPLACSECGLMKCKGN
jgi:serine palmitoyltransferase